MRETSKTEVRRRITCVIAPKTELRKSSNSMRALVVQSPAIEEKKEEKLNTKPRLMDAFSSPVSSANSDENRAIDINQLKHLKPKRSLTESNVNSMKNNRSKKMELNRYPTKNTGASFVDFGNRMKQKWNEFIDSQTDAITKANTIGINETNDNIPITLNIDGNMHETRLVLRFEDSSDGEWSETENANKNDAT